MEPNVKKRKKKSFVQRTVKYGKRGLYGKGSHINDETYQYFLHILKVADHDFESEAERKMFVKNVFEQIRGNEITYCCNQVVSRVIDNLLPLAPDESVTNLARVFAEDLRIICTNPFASYVLQKLIVVCTKRYSAIHESPNVEEVVDTEVKNIEKLMAVSYKSWILKVGKFLENNLEYFVWDSYANHVIRTMLACLAGIPDLDCKQIANKNDGFQKLDFEIEDDFKELTMSYINQLTRWPQFSDTKVLLRSISGFFKSNQLTAIMGASGAGKSTLLNLLAGYNTGHSNGTILVNGKPRDVSRFRKMSRYIMQEDLLQPKLTVMESMKIAAHLKLGTTISSREKYIKVEEILRTLRLLKVKNSLTSQLSGGEKKRLSVALELVSNPPVIFLDEPTTGLDDVSSYQCISLLKMLATAGQTIICSIHTPSARLFSMFDHIYVLLEGYCAFAGQSEDVVPYLSTLGLHCPIHYNPADFVIEVSNREYGDYTEKMVMGIENGRCYRWNKPMSTYRDLYNEPGEKQLNGSVDQSNDISKYNLYEFNSSPWVQFNVLLYRMMLQTWRDRVYILVKCIMYMFTGLVIGGMYFQMGNDATKTLFNFGFCFVTNIVFMYIPMLPILLSFPSEVLLLKREYFNRWYGLNAYFLAHTLSRMPIQFLLCMFYIVITYIMTDQPLDWSRGIKFTVVCIYIAIVSESLGYAISAQLNVVNSIFVGPALSVPFMLLAVYGLGSGSNSIPLIIRIAMHFSYIRYGLEGLVMAIYGNNRNDIPCPIVHCEMRYPDQLLKQVGMENINYWYDIIALTLIFVLLKTICYVLLRRRLSTTPSSLALSFIGRFIKTHFTLTR